MLRRVILAFGLLAPALATAASHVLEANTTSALITFTIPAVPHQTPAQDFTLRLQVDESEEPCSYPNLKINGQALSQGIAGVNHASFIGEGGKTFVGRWDVACLDDDKQNPSEMLVKFKIDMFSGRIMDSMNFSAHFRQVKPAGILEIDGPVQVAVDLPSSSEKPSSAAEATDGEAETSDEDLMYAELAELEHLRFQLVELERLVRLKEKAIKEAYGLEAKESRKHCATFKCMFGSFVELVVDKASDLYYGIVGEDGFFDHRPPQDKSSPADDAAGSVTSPPQVKPSICHCVPQGSHYLGKGKRPGDQSPKDGGLASSTTVIISDDAETPMTPTTSPIIKVTVSATAKASFVQKVKETQMPLLVQISIASMVIFCVLAAIFRCCRRRSFAERWSRMRARQEARRAARRAREERQANHRRRITAFRTAMRHSISVFGESLSNIFRRPSVVADEERASAQMMQQRPLRSDIASQLGVNLVSPFRRNADTLADRPPRVDPESESELSTTMDEEIARFREAAGVVDSLVSAEDTRLRTAAAARDIQGRVQAAERDIRQRVQAVAQAVQRMHTWEAQPVGGGRPSWSSVAAPSSPRSAYRGYSSDESPPAYESEDEMQSASFLVADGFNYHNLSPAYTPSESTTSRYTPSTPSNSSTGVNDILGPPKDYD